MASENPRRSASAVNAVGTLLEIGKPHLGILLLAFVCMVLVAVTTGAYAWLLGPALRFLLTGGTSDLGLLAQWVPEVSTWSREKALTALPIVIIVIGAIKGVGYLGQFYFVGLFGQHVVMSLRRSVFGRLLTISPYEMSRNLKGDLLSRFTADMTAVEEAATYTVASWLRDSLQVVVLVLVAFSLSWKLSLLALVALPIAVFPAMRLTRSLLKRTREGMASMGLLAAQVQEGLGALKTIQAFNAERYEQTRFDAQAQKLSRAFTRAAWTRAAVPGVMEVLAAAAIAGTLAWASGTQWVDSQSLVSFLATVILLYQPAKDLGRVTQFAVAAAAALERIEVVLAMRAPVVDRADATECPPVKTAIAFNEVHFSWGDRPALRGVSLSIPVGKTTALVGPSGSGKSTLAALLLRLEAPADGSIAFDGVDAAGLTVASVRRQCALVTQDALLFSGSVAENISAGRDLTSAQLEAAAKVAQAHDFIQELPQGYATVLGERGVKLSGGQRQRICIARAVASGAAVLVFDEATSNLDSQSEREVQAALEALPAGTTALVIAHRLSTVRRADCIYVLSEGRVVETGTHEELLEVDGQYARMWKAPG